MMRSHYRTLKRTTMKRLNNTVVKSTMGLIALVFVFLSCKDEEEGFSITNDLRVLQVKIDGSAEENGVTDLTVVPSVDLVFSHALSAADFESALTITPSAGLSFSYDESGSIVTIEPSNPLSYETEYSISLPSGEYGEAGEEIEEDFAFAFTTKEFSAPTITLTSSAASFFEGESITITAKASEAIFLDISMDITLGGSAEGSGVDYTASATSLTIPSGQLGTTFTIDATEGDAIEGEENILISLSNLVNAVSTQELNILLGDEAPDMILKGVMELENYIDGSSGRVRAVHLEVLKDIPDLSIFGVEITSNDTPPNPEDIDFIFPSQAASAGDQLFIVRDADAANAAAYFGSNYSVFTEFQTASMSHNGDDAILLYKDGTAIESFGEPGVDGTDTYWEYSNSWAYKLGEEWYYPGVGCAENLVGTATDETSTCRYPAFHPGVEFRGIMDLNHNGGTNLRAYHLFALRDIPDLSVFGAGVASNGQCTSDGVEIPFSAVEVSAGEHILVIRDSDVTDAQAYFEGCMDNFDHVVPNGNVTSNGDDTIELFKNNVLIETYGELCVDGTGQVWEYDNSWAYKVAGQWTYGGVGCSTDAVTNATSSCPYTFCTE